MSQQQRSTFPKVVSSWRILMGPSTKLQTKILLKSFQIEVHWWKPATNVDPAAYKQELLCPFTISVLHKSRTCEAFFTLCVFGWFCLFGFSFILPVSIGILLNQRARACPISSCLVRRMKLCSRGATLQSSHKRGAARNGPLQGPAADILKCAVFGDCSPTVSG